MPDSAEPRPPATTTTQPGSRMTWADVKAALSGSSVFSRPAP
jgi:hypothetical protein